MNYKEKALGKTFDLNFLKYIIFYSTPKADRGHHKQLDKKYKTTERNYTKTRSSYSPHNFYSV